MVLVRIPPKRSRTSNPRPKTEGVSLECSEEPKCSDKRAVQSKSATLATSVNPKPASEKRPILQKSPKTIDGALLVETAREAAKLIAKQRKQSIPPQISVQNSPHAVAFTSRGQSPRRPLLSISQVPPAKVSSPKHEVFFKNPAQPQVGTYAKGRIEKLIRKQRSAFYRVRKAFSESNANPALVQPLIYSSIVLAVLMLAISNPARSLFSQEIVPELKPIPTPAPEAVVKYQTPIIQTSNAAFESFGNVVDARSIFGENIATPSKALEVKPIPLATPEVQVEPVKIEMVSAPPPMQNAMALARLTPPQNSSEVQDETYRRISKMKFIAGMIAIHLPTINDCGTIAREIVEISAEKNIDPFYIAAVISVESRFGTHAKSRVGATGLMQLMPGTAKEVLETRTGRRGYPVLTDPRTNIKLGIEYLKELERRYRGNRFQALAAYNWGMSNVDGVKAGTMRYPASVSKYARTILERTTNWRKHYAKAEKSAESITEGLEKEAAKAQG